MLPFVAVTVQVPSSSTRFGTSAVTVSVPEGRSQDAAVTNGVTVVRVPGRSRATGSAPGPRVAVGVALGTGAGVSGVLDVGAGIDGSVTSVERGDDVTTGDGATCSSEHEVSATRRGDRYGHHSPGAYPCKRVVFPHRPKNRSRSATNHQVEAGSGVSADPSPGVHPPSAGRDAVCASPEREASRGAGGRRAPVDVARRRDARAARVP